MARVCVCACVRAQRTLDGLDLGVGAQLHVGRAEERGAGVAALGRTRRPRTKTEVCSGYEDLHGP